MALILDEDLRMLEQAAADFVSASCPVSALRKLRDEDDDVGFDRQVWSRMAELGWAGVLIDEQHGGSDFGFPGLAVVLRETGRTLTASPLLSTALIGASLISAEGTEAQRDELLEPIASGRQLTALALEEGPHHAPDHIELDARVNGDDFVLTGEKRFVLDGHVADTLLVAARTSGYADEPQGVTLFALPADTPGVTIARTRLMDSRNAANVTLDGVLARRDQILGGERAIGSGAAPLTHTLDLARIGIAAEMLGGTEAIFTTTLEYLKLREQFGVKIGSFQALKHRMAELFAEIELAKSAVMGALEAVSTEPEQVPQLASLCKARACDVYELATSEALQLHGGIGMTDDSDVGLFLKRSRVAAATFGNARFHRDRYARLCGF